MKTSSSDPPPLEPRKPLPDVRIDEDRGGEYVPLPTTLCLLVDRTLARRETDEWIDYFLKFEVDDDDDGDLLSFATFEGTLNRKSQRVRTTLTQIRRAVSEGTRRGSRWYAHHWTPLAHRVFARLVFYSYRAADLPESKLRDWASRRGSAVAGWGGLTVIDLLGELSQEETPG